MNMSACLLSQDVLAICLVLAEGDLDVSLEDVVSRAEQYQKMANRHFGILDTDFRWLLRWLTAYHLQTESFGPEMDAFRLRDVADGMLRLHDAYCNDVAEYWVGAVEESMKELDKEVRESFFYLDLDDRQWNEKLQQREALKAFFGARTDTARDLGSIRGLMVRLNIGERVLRTFSRPGSAS